MSFRVFVETFLVNTLLNCTRSGYYFSKTFIKEHYDMSGQILASMDAAIYAGLGSAFFCAYFLTSSTHQAFSFKWQSILCMLFYSMLPLLALWVPQKTGITEVLIVLCLCLYGLFQFMFLPVCLSLVNAHFNPQQNGSTVGLWSSSRSAGNILGVFGASGIIVSLGIKWEYCMLLFSLLTVVATFKLSFTIRSHQTDRTVQPVSELNQCQDLEECSSYVDYIKQQLTSGDFILYITIFSLLKVIVYTLLLWLPIYMKSQHKQSQEALVPAMFSLMSVVGSYTIGKLYQQIANSPSLLNWTLVLFAVIVVAGLSLIVAMQQFSQTLFLIVIAITGLLAGGMHNVFQVNQAMNFNLGKSKQQLVRFVNLSGGIANCAIGVVELTMGITMGQRNGNNFSRVFQVLLVVSVLMVVLLGFKAVTHMPKEQEGLDTLMKRQFVK